MSYSTSRSAAAWRCVDNRWHIFTGGNISAEIGHMQLRLDASRPNETMNQSLAVLRLAAAGRNWVARNPADAATTDLLNSLLQSN